jgi:hypothetical protein
MFEDEKVGGGGEQRLTCNRRIGMKGLAIEGQSNFCKAREAREILELDRAASPGVLSL